ncbi:trehalose-phosphatase [uncultured Azohydromonas sp.]|uniref:trehalose-phosphatase n=1 Tax=uncultured Azohydromonas sp. TaxID=487342 RepID=UPI0026342BAE|nr:trehalose-phosphatase [uncultured Azohydromonas sp.]
MYPQRTLPGAESGPGWPDCGCALFFDFDGTLVDIAPTPATVVVDPALPPLLQRLAQQLSGAVAIVSGRALADIDALLGLPRLCAAGVHGAEWRALDSHVRRIPVPALKVAVAPLQQLCARFPGLRLEHKPGALALHYRQAPELEAQCLQAMHDALQRVEGMALQRGKLVVELKPRGASKAAAVRRFLEQRPFQHRRAWFFGDDVTDESAFEAVQAAGGVTVKVGEGETLAEYRLAGPRQVRDWIEAAVDRLETGGGRGLAP